ncbi:MAG: hypothetical protein QOI95_305 [Acidimicrobiaceae bacterium]|jgi:glycosyltransferase involved in cell wall biosynthesis
MTGEPRIGIVMPAYNADRFLRAALESILNQSEARWTCLVVDDGSTDDTAAIAAEAARVDPRFMLRTIANSGPCVARNVGLAQLPASVEFVTFMDADDVWQSDALRTLTDALDSEPGIIGAHGLGEFIDEAGSPFRIGEFAELGRSRITGRGGRLRQCAPTEPSTFDSVFTSSVVFPPGVVLLRRSVYDAIGGFDDESRLAEDWDVLIRAARLGELRFVDKVILGYRRHDANVGTYPGVAEACHRVRVKAYYSPDNNAEQRRLVAECWRAIQRDQVVSRVTMSWRSLRSRQLGAFSRHAIRALVATVRLVLRAPRPRHAARALRSPR